MLTLLKKCRLVVIVSERMEETRNADAVPILERARRTLSLVQILGVVLTLVWVLTLLPILFSDIYKRNIYIVYSFLLGFVYIALIFSAFNVGVRANLAPDIPLKVRTTVFSAPVPQKERLSMIQRSSLHDMLSDEYGE